MFYLTTQSCYWIYFLHIIKPTTVIHLHVTLWSDFISVQKICFCFLYDKLQRRWFVLNRQSITAERTDAMLILLKLNDWGKKHFTGGIKWRNVSTVSFQKIKQTRTTYTCRIYPLTFLYRKYLLKIYLVLQKTFSVKKLNSLQQLQYH